MRFVVYGAGAVGGVLGGHLARDKHDVLLICREEHARVIREQDGLRMKSATGEYVAPLRASPVAKASDFDTDTCILFVPKSNDTPSCVEELAGCAPVDTPLVSFQNGIANEKTIAEMFTDVYGGVCWMTCSFLHPGQVSFRKFGRVVIGKYPKGAHAYAKKLGKVFESAGFQAAVSNQIMCDKWLKLVANLKSAFNALIDDRDLDSVEFNQLEIGVLEEAKRVLKAGNVRARSCDGKDFSVDEMIDDLKKPRAPRVPSAVRVHNSTWQNLYLKRGKTENDYFHGPIVALAQAHGITVPYNEVALELVARCARERTAPGQLRAADILERIHERKAAS
jgi:2-dehydropantoate 2-reductase